jgi:hypothetical protein
MSNEKRLEEIRQKQAAYAKLMGNGWEPHQLSNMGWLCLIDVPWLLSELEKAQNDQNLPPKAAETVQTTNAPAVDLPRLVRHRLGRVEIDREIFMVERHPCLAIASKLSATGFPLNLGIMGTEMWSDEEWKWGKFREAAAQVGASWWAWHEDVGERSLIFEWGSMANSQD